MDPKRRRPGLLIRNLGLLTIVLTWCNGLQKNESFSAWDSSRSQIDHWNSPNPTKFDTAPFCLFLSSCKKYQFLNISKSYLCLILLSTSGDINPNPGPSIASSSSTGNDSSLETSTYYPCGACMRQVTWEDKAICCEQCYSWFHIECNNINSDTYEQLKVSSAAWICQNCGEVNYSQHAFQFSIEGFGDLSSNKYYSISDPANDSTGSMSHLGLPLYSSSPKKQENQPQTFQHKKPKTMRVIVLNCQSLKNKPEQLQNMVDTMKPDIVIGTESWLIPEDKEKGILSSEVFPEGYKMTVARRDRQDIPSYSNKPEARGGGTFIIIKDDMTGIRQNHLETDCEIVWTKVELCGHKSAYIASYYRPHENDRQSLEELENSLGKICNKTSAHIWLGGDFNFPGFNWKEEYLKSGCSQPELTRKFIDIAAESGLSQVVKEPTFFENTLDLFLTNNPSLVQNCQVIPGISKDGHHAVCIDLDVSTSRHVKKPREVFSYKRADWEAMKRDMGPAMNNILTTTSEDTPVDDILDAFTKALEEAQAKHIPSRMTKAKERPPWITQEIRTLLRKQKKLFAKQNGSASATRVAQKYRSLKALTQRSIRKAYWSYVDNILTDTSTDETPGTNKKFWSFIKHQRQEAQGVASLKHQGKLEANPVTKATILNNQFQSVFSSRNPLALKNICAKACDFPEDPQIPRMSPLSITEEGVHRRLEKLQPHKAAGPDKMKPKILKELADIIAPVITRIYRASLKQTRAPQAWKRANVTAVFKKGEKYKPSNYRPISLTSILCKQMEHIIASHLMNHLNSNKILYNKQHGFRSKLSCETQLIEFTSDLFRSLQDRKQMDVIVMDFSKAFDKVPHNRLMYKLERAKLDPSVIGWIGSFLNERTQRVVVDGEESPSAPVTSGVPQGSVLGPILFLIYINDMPLYTKHSQIRLFADDTIAYLTVTSEQDCHLLQEDLRRLESWEKEWQMEFHPAKCNIIRITRKHNKIAFPYQLHGHTLTDVPSAKYLGVTITEDLTWNKHIEKISASANRKLGFLKRNIKTKDSKLKEKAYKAIVRPSVEYCSTVWDPASNNLRTLLEKTQRRAARWVTGRYHNTSSVTGMLRDLGWRTLTDRRVDSRLIMLFKIKHGLVNVLASDFFSLHRDNFHIKPIHAKSKYFNDSFFPRTINDWNKLPTNVISTDKLSLFRTLLMKTSYDLLN